MKGRAFVDGYLAKNLGDDLFILILLNRYKATKFSMYASSDYKKFIELNHIKNLKLYSPCLLSKVYNRIVSKLLKRRYSYKILLSMQYEIYIKISGSIYMEKKIAIANNPKLEYGSQHYRYKKVDRFFIGNNFGPYQTENYKKEYELFFHDCKDVCFRDKYSYDLFKDNCNNVRWASDVVFGLTKCNLNYKHIISEHYVVISVINFDIREEIYRYSSDYFNMLVRIINYYIKHNHKVVLMSFCDKEGDGSYIDKILSSGSILSVNDMLVYSYDFNIEHMLSIIKFADAIIATRFHSMILGWLYEVPTVPIIYSDKMLHVMKDSNFNGVYINLQDMNTFDTDQLNDLNNNILLNIKDIIAQSELQFQKLDAKLDTK